MRVLKHPVHPMIVHFPVAFLVAGSVCDAVTLFGVTGVAGLAGVFLSVGVIAGAPAILTGIMDYVRAPDAAIADANRHALLMCSAWTAYLVALMWRQDAAALANTPLPWSMAASFTGLTLLLAGAWYGGQLVYAHGVGMQREHGVTEGAE